MTSESQLRWELFKQELNTLVPKGHIANEIHQDDISILKEKFQQLRDRSRKKQSDLIKKLEKLDEKNPAFLSFSLLGVLHGTGLKETAHTRLLAWLFDPKKAKDEHGLNSLFIPVLEWVRPNNMWPPGGYEIIDVVAEKRTEDDKRIDLWIEGKVKTGDVEKEWLAVIEAKVEANLRDGQLKDYEKEAEAWYEAQKTTRLKPLYIFLNKGDLYITKKDANQVWIPLDFMKLFELLWLKIKSEKSNELVDGFQLARYYLAGILSDVEGWRLPLKALDSKLDYQIIDLSLILINRIENKESQ